MTTLPLPAFGETRAMMGQGAYHFHTACTLLDRTQVELWTHTSGNGAVLRWVNQYGMVSMMHCAAAATVIHHFMHLVLGKGGAL